MDKELILAKLEESGLPKDLFDQITAESEDELAEQIAELKAKNKKSSLAELLKEAGIDDELNERINEIVDKKVQSETDRRVTMAIEKVTKKINKATPGQDDEYNEQIGELNRKIDSLTEALTGQQKAVEQQRLKDLSAVALEKSGLPKKWLGRVNVEKESDIELVVKELKEEFDQIKQETADEIIKNSPIPGLSIGTGGDVTKTKIEKFAKELEQEQSQTNVVKLD